MTNILIGIDLGRNYELTMNLAERLQFDSPHWLLAHSVDVGMAFAGYSAISEAPLAFDFFSAAQDAGNRALEIAEESATGRGWVVQKKLLTGSAVGSLLKLADETSAEIIALHSERKGALGSLFLGSVSRGIAIAATRSLLISKGTVPAQGPVSAVFATDHSPYAGRALDKFLSLKMKGLQKIQVLSALHLNDQGLHLSPTDLRTEVERQLLSDAEEKTAQVVRRLEGFGYCASGEVVNLPVNDAIRDAMRKSESELLIMGAQGHGFLERIMLGSTSLHQVVAEPYSILLLRA